MSGWPSLYFRRAENLHKVWYEGVGIKIENPMTNKRRKVRQQQLNLFEPTNIVFHYEDSVRDPQTLSFLHVLLDLGVKLVSS